MVPKGKYEGRGGCKSKVIIKRAKTAKGEKGDQQSPVAVKTRNGEELVTKAGGNPRGAKTMVKDMTLGDMPIQDLKPLCKSGGHGDTRGSIAAGESRQGSPPDNHNSTCHLLGTGSGDGSPIREKKYVPTVIKSQQRGGHEIGSPVKGPSAACLPRTCVEDAAKIGSQQWGGRETGGPVKHRWELSSLRYHSIRLIYHYPFWGVFFW